ncbi:betaine/proline/choline family ABC transporter ATP-binding protein [Clostridium sp.]|uniref:betaine/proline/choline family ABC transporter ATP-binding protein n=1 Tax=Clostridium sp. TaxID=1506 RepID=UPI001A4B9D7D|nr:betaine/proline/choline family ABC transporter ATP-binding protein [Clostridium sp.]MBK5235772.1 betaine/proline/choline family ABC transporter ATP-binding protein [Clostridium sp.]
MIQLKKINKVYDDGFQALKDIDLTFEEGKINVLIGPSGCGKTTTMKLLNRLTDFTDGEILIDGKDIKQINPIELRRKMGYVIQNVGLFPHMNIYENVATVPKLLKWDKKRIQQRVDELLNMVNLDPKSFRHRYPSKLSGGQKQRIGVIRALAAEPFTILMDEPFSALDPITREQLQDELIRLQREINKTIIFVTHDMDEAIKIADQIILMKDGRIVQKGSPSEILANPANDFVEEFIGVERLENAKTLPPLSEFIKVEYPCVSSEQTVAEAIEIMISNNVAEIPVIDALRKYVGIISIYVALASPKGILKELTNVSDKALLENIDINMVMKQITKMKTSIIPIISESDDLVGVLDHDQLFKALQQSYENKTGGV